MKKPAAILFLLTTLTLLAALAGQPPVQNGLPGDPIQGGRLYDNWMLALDLKAPEGDQPLWAEQSENTRSGDVTWRCKECHGWDYKGAAGAYGPASLRYTGFKGLEGIIGQSQETVVAWLDGTGNPNHDFKSITDPNAIDDLAAFLRTMQVDTALFIDYESGLALGDDANGQLLYSQGCAECHGNSGREIDFSATGRPLYVGDIAAVDPWRTLHKIRFGTATGNMPSAEQEGWSLRNIADVLVYAQSLPRGNPDYEIARDVSDDLNVDRQGETEPILWAALLILVVIAVGLGWEVLQNRRQRS